MKMSDDDKTIEASKPRDLTETEVELASQILREIDDGTRTYPDWYYEQYQEDDFGDDDEDDDPDAIDPETLGKWDPSDLETGWSTSLIQRTETQIQISSILPLSILPRLSLMM